MWSVMLQVNFGSIALPADDGVILYEAESQVAFVQCVVTLTPRAE